MATIAQPTATDIDTLCINTIRTLSIDAIQKANSGHPGTPMALAPVVSQGSFPPFSSSKSELGNRDRFILSCGHAVRRGEAVRGVITAAAVWGHGPRPTSCRVFAPESVMIPTRPIRESSTMI